MKTLYGEFCKVVLLEYPNLYEKYIDSKRKWHEAVMTNSQLGIAHSFHNIMPEEEVKVAEKSVQKLIFFFYEKMEEAEKSLFEILRKEIPWSGIKHIQGYTEFDLLEWDLEDNSTKIKFRPKNIAVSFWHADPKKIEYEKN